VMKNLSALARLGRLTNIAYQAGPKVQVDFRIVQQKLLTLGATGLRGRPEGEKRAIRDQVLKEVWPLIEAGRIKPVTHKVFSLGQAGDSHPAIWSKEVVSAMKSELSLIKQSTDISAVPWFTTRKTSEEIFEQTLPIKQFLAISERYLSAKDTKTWLNRLLDKLRKILIS